MSSDPSSSPAAVEGAPDPVAPTLSVVTSNKPQTPIMGGITLLAKDEWVAWTGGTPKADWSGLDPSSLTTNTTPNQLRPLYASSSQKRYNHRRTGLTNVYSPSADLTVFQNAVWNHLLDTGIDSIAYLQDPEDGSRMTNVVKSHARFTVQSAKSLIDVQASKYDSYDRTNDVAARAFLLASLETSLSNKIEEKIEDNDSFPIVWLQLIKTIQSTSIERFEDLKQAIKKRHPSQYSGENLEQLAADFRKDARELTTAGQYDHNLTLAMLKIFLQAGGAGNEDFRFPLRSVKQELDQALLDIGYKEKTAANKHMVDNKLTNLDICRHAEDTYRLLYDRKEWPPARNVRDSKAPPAAFAVECDTPLTRTEVWNLIQSSRTMTRTNAKPGSCHKCGKPGHWANECPSSTGSDGNVNNRRPAHNQSSRPPRGNGNAGQAHKSWKSTPPASGSPTTKKHNDKTFNWCSKCNRWTTTHTTATHTGAPSNQHSRGNQRQVGRPGNRRNTSSTPPQAPAANLTLFRDPSVWHMDVPPPHDDHPIITSSKEVVTQGKNLLQTLATGTIIAIGLQHGGILHAVLSALKMFLSMVLIPGLEGTLFAAQHLQTHPELIPALVLWTLIWTLIVVLNLPLWYRPPDLSSAMSKESPLSSPHIGIRTLNHHRRYPLRLQNLGHYTKGKPPTCDIRRQGQLLNELKAEVLSLQANVHKYRRPCKRYKKGKLDELPSTRILKSLGPFPKPRAPKAPTKYKPVLASARCSRRGSTHGLGHMGWTMNQINAAHKIAVQVHMARMPMATNAALLRMALQAPLRFRSSLPEQSSSYPIIWDSGASFSVSPDIKDFDGPLEKPGAFTQLQGIAKGLRIEGHGHVLWALHDTEGNLRIIRVPAYYAPKLRVRLLSTTSLLQSYPAETITIQPHQLTLSGEAGNPTRGSVIARVDPRNNLPTSDAHSHKDIAKAVAALEATLINVSDANHNLSDAEKELLRWHYRLGHVGFKRVQFLMRTGVLNTSEATKRLHTAACKITHPPKCAACLYGKQHRRPAPNHRTSSQVTDRTGVLKTGDLQPGQQVSVDHFICSTKGRLLTSKGKTPEKEMYVGGCLFIDHASNYVHVEFQQHMTTHQTLESKTKYEQMCRDHGITPTSFLTDNGSCFTSAEFQQKLTTFEQILRFAGVGAHHHNGNAERAIKTIMSISRTMMLHAAIHWPDVADSTLWPLAVNQAIYLHNRVPNITTGIAPIDVFTKSRWPQRHFHDLHVWGCPVYVLEKAIADGRKIPRWQPRSVRTINMLGFSFRHASTVPLVLNPNTGYITPQFHVVFDDWFATVSANVAQLPDISSAPWSSLFSDSTYQYFTDDDITDLTPDETDSELTATHQARQQAVTTAMDRVHPLSELDVPPPATSSTREPAPLPPTELLSPGPTSPPREPSHTPYDPSTPPVPAAPAPHISPPSPVTPYSPIPPIRFSPPPPLREGDTSTITITPVASPAPQVPSPLHSSMPPASLTQPLALPKPSVQPLPAPILTQPEPRRSTRSRQAPTRLGFDG